MRLFKSAVSQYFSKADLARIKDAVTQAEKVTSAEIRVKVITRMSKGVKDIRVQAVHEFEREGMTKTRDKTGLLILISLKDRQIQLLADKGIMDKLPGASLILTSAASTIESGFRTRSAELNLGGVDLKSHVQSLCDVIRRLGDDLSKYLPIKSDDKNELPNDVIIGGKP